MKTISELEEKDIQAIAEKVVKLLKPYLSQKADRQEDTIFDVPSLCEYLHVTSKWVHERTHLKEIPYYKLSNKKLAFRKRDIDKWLETRRIPAINDFKGKICLVQSA
ncbi:MAG: Helix-turn-helix domain protein [Deltaproteobacteria bacterium ADurb.Bin135]|jgi:predicted DNA-binding transcriptional regulator AlpA|nr:MAG: Helix-turn-helix domain protein [Deltaproteobacteria bacterium ADurb.Bin135]